MDNADDIAVFLPSIHERPSTIASRQRPSASFLSQTENGRIFIASHNRDAAERLAGSKWKTSLIQVMDKSQAAQLLLKKLYDVYAEEAEAAGPLAQALEYLPLAIT